MIIQRKAPFYNFLLLLPLLHILFGCSTNPATGDQSFTAFMSAKDEARVGAEEHPKLLKEFGGSYDDQALKAYVRHVGKKLAAVSEFPNLPWRFTVLNDPQVNAFALPGGYVYMTRGLLALAGNEAEIAGVLAHEIGHVTARHTAQRYSTGMATKLGLTGLGILGSVFGVPTGVGRIISTGAQIALQQYSQAQEMEADMLGLRYMARIGYDPTAMTSFLKKMRAHAELEARQKGKEGVPHNIMSTHPRNQDRVNQAVELAKSKMPVRPVTNADDYLNRIDGIIFGDDLSQGVVSGRVFKHPELGIIFKVPPEFSVFNSRRKVTAFGPNQARIVFDMANSKEASKIRNLIDYLKNVWGKNLNLQDPEFIEINGMRAATGRARAFILGQSRELRLVVVQEKSDRIYRLIFMAAPSDMQKFSEEFRRSTYSFRRLTKTEARAIQPLRLKVIIARTGDTVANVATKFPIPRFQREWFRLLNDKKRGQQITPGERIKVVTE